MTRYIVDYDPEARFEECNGESRPLTETEYAQYYYRNPDGTHVSYEDYLDYHGNPARHVYLYIQRQDRCPCCDSWVKGDSLYGIDFMDDSPEANTSGTFTIADLPGYLQEIAKDLEPAESILQASQARKD